MTDQTDPTSNLTSDMTPAEAPSSMKKETGLPKGTLGGPSPDGRPDLGLHAGTMTYVEDMVPMINVQEEATVSRTVMKAEGARMVLFSFDTGEMLTEHTAAMPVTIQTLEGTLRITADGQTVDLKPGGLVHLTTRLPHAVEALEPSKMALLMLDPR